MQQKIILNSIIKSTAGKPPVIFSGGEQIRCFTYVEDDVNANMLMLKNNSTIGQTYNAASKTRMSINELASIIIKKYSKDPNMKTLIGEARMGENLRPIPNTSKIEALGFKEQTSFEQGLEITKRWIEQDSGLKSLK